MIGSTYAQTRHAPVVVYGNRWCGITQMIRRRLDRTGVPYEYVDLDANPDVQRRLRWMLGRGFRRRPPSSVAPSCSSARPDDLEPRVQRFTFAADMVNASLRLGRPRYGGLPRARDRIRTVT